MHQPRKKHWSEVFTRSQYFLGALIFHLVLFLSIASWVIFKAPTPPQESFGEASAPQPTVSTPPPPKADISGGGDSAKGPTVSEPVAMPAAPPIVIDTPSASSFSVPMPKASSSDLGSMLTQSTSIAGNSGTSSGMGSGFGSGRGNGQGSMFGSGAGGGAGLEGNFYDFVHQSNGKHANITPSSYESIIKAFANGWSAPDRFQPTMSHATLYSKFFLFPPIADVEAGKAFQSPSTSDAFWIAHYHGKVMPEASGRFRFVAFGDNLCAIAIDGELVLDASDHGYLGVRRTELGPGVLYPGKATPTPLFAGSWFYLNSGTKYRIDLIFGDEGGIFASGVFLQPEGKDVTFSKNGVPLLPIFSVGETSENDAKMLKQYLPPECLTIAVPLTLQGN